MSETRKYRTFTPEQKIEIVLAGLRGDRPTRDVCREYQISEALFYQWRERLLEGGNAALATPRDKKPPEAAELAELKKKVSALERALGRKTYELEIAGELSRDWT
ncbi:MAG: transposase [Jatrophihabitantaceae bacterium]